ncbi:MAG TPA: hypothetical protein VHE30_13220 [Polyangiaceae bacterium]|nr:hypothetical protein [Polyangiaceae bacterium]
MRRPVVFLAVSVLLSAASAASARPTPSPAAPLLAKEAKGKAAAPKLPPPATLDKKVKLSPDGLKFGMTLAEVSKFYEKVLDDEFAPLYKRVEPGPRMNELDAELADKKQLILRNKLEFGSLPSGLDDTPLGGEYSYNNGEFKSEIKLRSGITRHFFFIGDRLWKVIDVHKLGKKSKLGEDFDGAKAGLVKQLGKEPRALSADPSQGRKVDFVDWQDKEMIIRLMDFGGSQAAVGYIDRKIEEGIDKFRPNKGPAQKEVDRDVADVTRGPTPPTPKR